MCFYLLFATTEAGKKKVIPTLTSTFTSSLGELLVKMNAADPYFIRCLKPNLQQVPNSWQDDMISRQLLYAGVMETVRIRKVIFLRITRFSPHFPNF
jgi:myosin heavy subunit